MAGGAEKVPCRSSAPIRQPRSIASAQRRTQAADALVGMPSLVRERSRALGRQLRASGVIINGLAEELGGHSFRRTRPTAFFTLHRTLRLPLFRHPRVALVTPRR